jgi:hypothetical protein
MRLFMAVAVGTSALCASTSHAYVTIASNQPVPAVPQGNFMVQNGEFSDALNSGGTNWYGLGLAQGFTSSGGHTVDRLTVWGGSEYLGSQTPWTEQQLSANITGFQVVLMKQNLLGAYITQQSWIVNTPSVTQMATGDFTSDTLSPVFQLSMDLGGSFMLGSGVYYLAVGAILADGDGDSWQWIDGLWSGADPDYPFIATTGDTPTSWGQWAPVSNGSSGSMLLESTIPGPGALALMAAALLTGGRRRRR